MKIIAEIHSDQWIMSQVKSPEFSFEGCEHKNKVSMHFFAKFFQIMSILSLDCL